MFYLFFIGMPSLKAQLLVGVELYYSLLSSNGFENTYSIEVNYYYEPYTCDGSTTFDVGEFHSVQIRTLNPSDFYSLFVQLDTIIDVPLPVYPCLEIPNNICAKKVRYSNVIALPVIDSSYFVLLQSCCRVDSLINIIPNVQPRGISNFIEITATAQQEGNSMPLANDSIPLFFCLDAPFYYSFSYNDSEGDQLVYELCEPPSFDSGFVNSPFPLPPFLSPVYNLPGYHSLNPLGNDMLTLNSITGELYAYPTEVGSFLIGVCISEYRNGVLLSTMTKDFVLNIIECSPQVEINLIADSIELDGTYLYNLCDTNQIQINNLSQDPDYITDYYWLINNQIYTDWNPNIIFPASGSFDGQLILNPGQLCSDTAFLDFHVVEEMSVEFIAEYDTCIAGKVSFVSDVIYTNLADIQYLWNLGDGHWDTLSNLDYYYDSPGYYDVDLRVTDVRGCKSDVMKRILWNPAPETIVVAPDTYEGCAPLDVHFDNRSWPIDSTYSVVWDFGDGQSQHGINGTHNYSFPGIYSVGLSIVSPIGCHVDTVFSDWIDIVEKPLADFTYTLSNISTQTPLIVFKDQSLRTTFWEWHFSETDVAHYIQHPTYAIIDTGIYQISLMAFDEYWCSDTIVKQIKVNPVSSFYFPNAFSPNNDGLNDVFKTAGTFTALNSWYLSIWNRYGELLFESNNPNEGWNGLFQNYGSPIPQGVYIYKLNVIDHNDEKIKLKGFCTLIR